MGDKLLHQIIDKFNGLEAGQQEKNQIVRSKIR
jgi:hypothetical protein